MQTSNLDKDPNSIDEDVDVEIARCLNLSTPKSFFLFAGAGSGKTQSLKDALLHIRNNYGSHLRLHSQRVAVITYTNKAADEIKHRVGYDPLIEVSTIHSFVWALIQGLNNDIRAWLKRELEQDIVTLEEKVQTSRSEKTRQDRLHDIESKKKRLENLSSISKFIYNPNGENKGKDSLNHSEVIKITASFLLDKEAMQLLLIKRFPVLLIDESQDTDATLMNAFLSVQGSHPNFILGLFGDLMQRIFAGGKEDLGRNLPPTWATPTKKMNHRCPKRIVTLINKLREDGQTQQPRTDAIEGVVRFFIVDRDIPSKKEVEKSIAKQMAEFSQDILWHDQSAVKTLILEHHMAAKRLGFYEMYEPLYKDKTLSIGLLDGTLGGIKFFSERILPLVEAKDDKFTITAIIRKHSPLVSKVTLRSSDDKQMEQLQKAKTAVESLLDLFSKEQAPRFIDILRNINSTGLFEIPDGLMPIANRSSAEQVAAEAELAENVQREERTTIDSWDEFLVTPFWQIKPYSDYINDRASFDTHQGVKGLQFPRVMVIIDDEDARGFLFSYDKMSGMKERTATDLKNEKEQKDTSVSRTKRLFYVTCSRAEKSLAILYYSENAELLKRKMLDQGWFEEHEIMLV